MVSHAPLRNLLLAALLLAGCSSDATSNNGQSGDTGSTLDAGLSDSAGGSADAESDATGENRCDAGFVKQDGECVAENACDGCIADETCVPEGGVDPTQACSVCTADGWSTAGADVVCRPADGECDAEERCDGTSRDCPTDVMMPDEPGPTACGFNDNGALTQTCVAGTWQDTDTCEDPDECTNGESRTGNMACGQFWSGGIGEDCVGGAWSPTGQCVDTATEEVLDVVPGPEGGSPIFIGSFQRNGTTITIFDPQSDEHPWATDGTGAGTEMLAFVAASGGFTPAMADLGNGEALFVAGDAFRSLRLFRTDGTAAGTTVVGNTDIQPRSPGLYQGHGLGIFLQREGASDNAVWASDGTDAGTVEILDKAAGEYSVWLAGAFESEGKTVFSAESPNGVTFLYCTDGTEAGTRGLTGAETFSGVYKEWNGNLYLRQRRVGEGRELVEVQDCEGNVRGTDINPSGDSNPSSFTPLDDDTMVFRATHVDYGYELWRVNAAGDVSLVKDINPGPSPSIVSAIVEVAGLAYFFADDGTHGRELWASDGTDAGTRMVLEIDTTDVEDQSLIVALGNRVLFVTPDAAGQSELWSSDGTAAGTVPVTAFASNNNNVIGDISVVGPVAFFTATEPVNGTEIWVTTGDPAQVSRVTDYGVGPRSGIIAHYPTPHYLFAIGHEVNTTYGREPIILTP